MKRLSCSCLLILLVLIFYPKTSGAVREAPRLVSPTALMSQSLQENWFRYRTLKQDGKLEEAQQALRSLKQHATDLGIENLDALSAALVDDARKVLGGGSVTAALDLAREAQELSPNYPTAYFFRGWLLLRYQPWKILEIIGEYLNGWSQAGKHIWMLLYGFGNGLLWLIGAAGAAIFTFILTVIIRYTPWINHILSELTKHNLDHKAIWFLIAAVLSGPLWLGLGIAWMLVWWLLIFWLFMTGRERGLALALVVLIASASLWLPPWVSVIKARTSPDFVVMAQSVRGEAALYPGIASFTAFDSSQPDWQVSMALGLQYKRSEQYELAQQYFEQAMKLRPDEERILINLGNVHLLANRLDEAIEWYQKTLVLYPNSVEAHYNLAQAYREKLQFVEGERHYEEARRLNPELTEQYTRRALVGLSHPVVDKPLTLIEALKKAFTSTDEVRNSADRIFSSLWNVPLWTAPLIGFGFITVVLLISRLTYIGSLSFPCALCGRTICQHCQKHIFHLRICENCQEVNKKVKRLIELHQIQRRRDRQITLARLFSLLLPGTGHFFLLHSLKGFIFAFAFFALILMGVLTDVRFFAPYAWISYGGGLVLLGAIAGMILIYITVFWDLTRIQVELGED